MSLNATPNSFDADSYATIAEAATYHASHLYGKDWADTEKWKDPEKEIALKMATRILDEKTEWVGFRTTDTQSLGWGREAIITETDTDERINLHIDGRRIPNDIIPQAIINATAEFAKHLLQSDLTAASNSDSASLSKIKVGTIELSYNKQETGDRSINTTGVVPLIVQEMLRGWGEVIARGSSEVASLVIVSLERS